MANAVSDHRSRHIRSFVRRDARMTPAQRRALDEHWRAYHIASFLDVEILNHSSAQTVPLNLEIGCGDGACSLQLARNSLNENFLAVEVYRPGLGNLLIRAAREKLQNIRISDRDVFELLQEINTPIFDRVFIFFPDPWPKKRHHKRRLLRTEFFDLLAPRMRRNGRVFIATDNEDYARSTLALAGNLRDWRSLSGENFAPRFRERPVTRFEQKARNAESEIFDIALARR